MSVVPIPLVPAAGGCALPAYGLGTWGMGGTFTRDPSDDSRVLAAIRAALERGVRLIDTAEMYGAGHAEELVGTAIAGCRRSELFLVSKVLAHHLAPERLITSCEASLRRLGTDYLDLYLIHHPSDATPLTATMQALDWLVDTGRVRFIGVSNFLPERFSAAAAAAHHPLVMNQVHYSLAVRGPERAGLVAMLRAYQAVLCAWQPIDRGPAAPDRSPLVRALAAHYGRTPRQVALNYLLSQPGTAVLSRTTDPAHLEENLGALGWQLTVEDRERLRIVYEPQLPTSEVYPLG